MDTTVKTRADTAFIRKAVEEADFDALRMAMYHNTGDRSFVDVALTEKSWADRAAPSSPVTGQEREALLDRVVDWLAENAGPGEPPELEDSQLREMFELAVGGPVGDLEYSARKEILSFREFPWFAEWQGEKPDVPEGFRVAIIGGGFSGIIMGVQLDQLGIDYVLLERRPENGGVWSINRYPDVRVDTLSITYELPFVKDNHWTEYFARGPEVRAHLNDAAKRFGVRDKTLYGHDLTKAVFDEARAKWTLTCKTENGVGTLEADAVVTCAGLFATPKIVDFEDKENFKGQIVHTARWPDDVELEGRKVAIIGNGSTGIQVLKPTAAVAKHVNVFQRTPQWISPRDKYGAAMPEGVNWLIDNLPGFRNWWRFTACVPLFETLGVVSVDEEWRKQGGLVNRENDAMRQMLTEYIETQTGGDQDLIDRLTPDYAPFSRRPVVDNDWYKSLTRDNVDLVTSPIKRLVENGIETEDGVVHEADVIVTATGFDVAKFLWPARFVGKDGVDLHAKWDEGDGPRAYLGMMNPGFPNLFTVYGPNSQPASGGPAQPQWFATWGHFVARSLMRMIEKKASRVEVTQEGFDEYNRKLDEKAKSLLMMSDLGDFEHNYYVDQKHRRLQVNAPWYAPDYTDMCLNPDWNDLTFD